MRPARRPRRTVWTAPIWTALALLAATATAAGPLLAGPAAAVGAEEAYDLPAGGVFQLDGHGWGHGHGLSQWGAQGAARSGVDADTILSTYYPGTTRGVLPDAPIRVHLAADEGRDTEVAATPGLRVTDLASGATVVLPAGPAAWRATADGSGLHLSSRTGSAWTPYPLGGPASAGPLRFAASPYTRVVFPDGTARDYRGAVQAQQAGAGVDSVVVLGLESYLLGVVPRESSSSWEPAALQAQAVAARSYSAWKRDHVAAGAPWDICDTTACQVFAGSRLVTADGAVLDLEPPSTTAAVRATAGVVRMYGGASIFAEFSSSNGGWSSDGGPPYLAAQRDDWDGLAPNPVHSWTAALRVSDLEKAFPQLGSLRRLRVVRRDGHGEWGGRVLSVVLEGDAGGRPTSVTTTGGGIYGAHSWPASPDGLRSTWWHLRPVVPAAPAAAPRPAAPARFDAAVVGSSRAAVVPRTGSVAVYLDVRNTGTVPWPVGGPVRVWTPAGSPSRSAGWPAPTRPGTLTVNLSARGARTVLPGQVARFTVVLAGNGRAPGAGREFFGVVWEHVATAPVRTELTYTVR